MAEQNKPLGAGALSEIIRHYRRIKHEIRISIDDLFLRGGKSFASLLRRKQANGTLTLVVDHKLGGGSNIFREKLVKQLLTSGQTSVLLVLYSREDKRIECHVHDSNSICLRHHPSSLDALIRLLAPLAFDEIIVNDLVSWPNPVAMMPLLCNLKNRTAAKLTIYFHEYFLLCPSWTLLNHLDQFCGLPDLKACDHCLSNHTDRWVTDVGITRMSIWREACGALLASADKIVCFSQCTATFIEKCYPAGDFRVAVIPHALLYVPIDLPKPDYANPLRIGVLGNIGFHKGERIVEELSGLISERGIDAHIVVIGRYSRPSRDNITVLGKYDREDLARLIDGHGINIFLFPSIWPETFSFVCAEIMALRMPLVAFNLGAPAERIRGYEFGLLVDEVGAEPALCGIISLYDKLGTARE